MPICAAAPVGVAAAADSEAVAEPEPDAEAELEPDSPGWVSFAFRLMSVAGRAVTPVLLLQRLGCWGEVRKVMSAHCHGQVSESCPPPHFMF